MKTTVNQIIDACADELIQIRRHIHSYPEVAQHEIQTSAFVAQKLGELGIDFRANIGGYGILAVIKGNLPGKTIALRADMDALPITEETGLPFASQNNGVMHACGHDIHVACLLGVARVLQQMRQQIKGTILLVFQPCEESIPGGANLMLQNGVFDEYEPEMIIAQHVYPELEVGQFGFHKGEYLASADEVIITCNSKGGHAALPHLTVDSVLMASQIVVSLQQVCSRFIPATVPAVLSFGKITCNSAMNIIPEKVVIDGTLRIMNEDWRFKAHDRIRLIANSVAQSMGGTCDVNIIVGYPSLFNNCNLTDNVERITAELWGEQNVKQVEARLTAEDFGWFSQKYPSCFYRLGVGASSGLHTPTFVADERAIAIGAKNMALVALKLLEN